MSNTPATETTSTRESSGEGVLVYFSAWFCKPPVPQGLSSPISIHNDGWHVFGSVLFHDFEQTSYIRAHV